MELEFFCQPGTDLEWFDYWRSFCHNFLLSIGLKDENLRLRDHEPEELCFYSRPRPTLSSCSPSAGASSGRCRPHRLRPDPAPEVLRSGSEPISIRRRTSTTYPLCHRTVPRRRPHVLAVLCDAYDEEVVGQDKKGNEDIRTSCIPSRARSVQVRDPAAEQEGDPHRPAMELYNELSRVHVRL